MNLATEAISKMDQTTQMKVLLEAVDVPKVDEPKKAYANSPDEQTLDSETQQNFGNDLHKKKSFQHPSRDGDNPRAAKLTEYTLEEARLTEAFEQFKLVEGVSIDSKWSTDRELAKILQAMINKDDDLENIVTKEQFRNAHSSLMSGDAFEALTELMSNYSSQNGGEMHDHDMVAEGVLSDLEDILKNRIDQTLETAGDSTGESETLKALHHKGVDHLDGVKAKVFGPTDAYPAPWTARHVGGKYPIYSIKAANKAEVATWLTQDSADTIISEIS